MKLSRMPKWAAMPSFMIAGSELLDSEILVICRQGRVEGGVQQARCEASTLHDGDEVLIAQPLAPVDQHRVEGGVQQARCEAAAHPGGEVL